MKTDQVRLGIIGVGGIANHAHLPSLKALDVHVVAICDIVKDRAEEAARRFSILTVYQSYKEMLAREEIDAVFRLVQPDQIFGIALDCLDGKKDVFLEKPPGIALFQTETLLRKALSTD